MSVLRIMVCLAVVCIVPTLSQRPRQRPRRPQQNRIRFPSQLEIKVALDNPDTVEKALQCIEGLDCNLPYGRLLKSAGPELVTLGRCPPSLCTPEQERQARWLILQIQQRYPRKFYATVQRLSTRRVFG